jgi:hypothetical protein
MSADDALILPPSLWRRNTSLMWEVWVIEDQGYFVAVVYKSGISSRAGIFYHLMENEWFHIVEFWQMGPPVFGLQPRFAEIVGCASDSNPSNEYFLVLERGVTMYGGFSMCVCRLVGFCCYLLSS